MEEVEKELEVFTDVTTNGLARDFEQGSACYQPVAKVPHHRKLKTLTSSLLEHHNSFLLLYYPCLIYSHHLIPFLVIRMILFPCLLKYRIRHSALKTHARAQYVEITSVALFA
jgi:hypothetical protein